MFAKFRPEKYDFDLFKKHIHGRKKRRKKVAQIPHISGKKRSM
jgi:hypothetical protein